MRKILFLIIIVTALASRAESQESAWFVGYAESDVTPAPGRVQMSGFGRERYASGALAPLLTQVVVLRDEAGKTGVLITADILDLDHVMVEVFRRAIGHKHKIPAENIMFAASHTHWGPAVRLRMGLSLGAPNVWYMDELEKKVLATVDEAVEDQTRATIEYGCMDFREIGCNRRRPADGQITWGPYPEGSFDGHTPIFRITRSSYPKQLILVGHACHPTSSGVIRKWSPDYPGAMRDFLAAALPDTKVVFVQGCGGDAKIVHNDPKTGKLVFSSSPERAKAAGEKLGGAVMEHLTRDLMMPLDGRLACSLATGQLSYGKRWSPEEIEKLAFPEPTGGRKRHSWLTWVARQSLAMPNQRESFRYDVQVWKLGGRLMIFGMEGEICSPWGPMLREMAPTERAMVVGYANGTGSYIPDNRIVREGGYEGLTSQHAYFLPAPFTEDIEIEIKEIVTRAINALE